MFKKNKITSLHKNDMNLGNKSSAYLSGIKLHCKASGIPKGFRASTLMDNSGEPNNNRRLYTWSPKKIGTCQMRNIMSYLKKTFGTCSPGMYNTFWNPFTIKISKLLHQVIILK
nr:hypothetical protein F511_45941 [Ipomoea trifida]GMD22905.1 peroxisomal catalase [Ipomoea batatas]